MDIGKHYMAAELRNGAFIETDNREEEEDTVFTVSDELSDDESFFDGKTVFRLRNRIAVDLFANDDKIQLLPGLGTDLWKKQCSTQMYYWKTIFDSFEL